MRFKMCDIYLFDPLGHFGNRLGPSRLGVISGDNEATDRETFRQNCPIGKWPCTKIELKYFVLLVCSVIFSTKT